MKTEFHPVTHVIFDMDGLLLNTEPKYAEAMSALCERYGSTYTEETKRSTQGMNARDSATNVVRKANLPISVDEFVIEIEKEYAITFGQGVDLMPGAEALVRHLKKHNIPICIATSSKQSTLEYKKVGHEEFFDLFHHIVMGSDNPAVKNGKPSPDIFQVAAAQFSQSPKDPKNVLVFEDSRNGVRAGLAAGMQVVWVPDANADTSVEKPTQIIKSLTDFNPTLYSLPPF